MAKTPQPAAIGFSVHTGWAVAVAVGGTPQEPVVLERARLVLHDDADGFPRFVFHAAEQGPKSKAEPFVEKAVQSTRQRARVEVKRFVETVRQQDHEVRGAGVALPAGKLPGSVKEILKSHPLLHLAEGALFRDALIEGCEAEELRIIRVLRKKLFPSASIELGRTDADVKQAVDEMGSGLGPPWGADQREAALLGWMALSMTPPSGRS